MTPLRKVEMALHGWNAVAENGNRGGVDELSRVFAAQCASGGSSQTTDCGRGGQRTAVATATGVSAVAGLRQRGAASLASKRRGKPSNNRVPAAVRELTMSLVKAHYADFGPTLAAEKLHEHQSCLVSRETLRKWMIEDGLWIDRRRRLPSVHQPRNRRERIGELIQIDGSKQHGFENRGPECSLIAYLDDATSRILHAAFVPSESTLDYLRETRTYAERHGRSIAFYSDKHAIFRVNNREAKGGDGMTQFGRALHDSISTSFAPTPRRPRAASSVRSARSKTAW